MEMYNSGLYTKEHARSKLSDVDVKSLEKQELKEKLRNSEAYLGTLLQHFIPLVNQALAEAGLPAPPPPMVPPGGAGQAPSQPTGSGRPLVPGIPNPTAPAGQGAGGGGNTQFGVSP